MINPKTGEKLDGCVSVVLDDENVYSYIYGSCEVIEVSLLVDLGDGTTSQEFNAKYASSSKIEIVDPTSENYEFNGWKITKGNSILKGNTLIIGTTETVLSALWK